jgi:hypothetical protein
LIAYPHLTPKFRISGVVPLLLIHAIMERRGTALPFFQSLSTSTHRTNSVDEGAHNFEWIGEGKAIPLQVLTGPEGSRRLRLPDFKTVGT